MLKIEELVLTRGQGAAAHRVHLPLLHVRAGEVLAITGASGCGKSTLLEGIGLLLEPNRLDSYALGEHDNVAELTRARKADALAAVRAADIGFILQNGGLLPFLTVRDNIALPRKLQGMPAHSAFVEHAVLRLGLGALLQKKPSTLSIGERQRVAFVRAMSHEPKLLLADEPTSALDPNNADTLFDLFLTLVEELGLAALVVSHDWELVERFGLQRITPNMSERTTTFKRERSSCDQ